MPVILSESGITDGLMDTKVCLVARKSRPGNWLFCKLGDLAQAVNSRLGK